MKLSATVVTGEVASKLDALKLSRVHYKNAVYIIETLLDKSWAEYSSDGWLYLRKALLRQMYGSKYNELFKKLEEVGILEICHEFSFYEKGTRDEYTPDPFPKSYRITPGVFDEGYAIRNTRADEEHRDVLTQDRRDQIKEQLERLEFDIDKAQKFCESHASGLSLEKDYYVNGEIFEDVVQITSSTKTFYGTVTGAAAIAAKSGQCIIQNLKQPNKAVVADPEVFIAEARANARLHWTRMATKMEAGIFYVRRNAVNNRVDTNLTSLPNQLCQYLTVDGEPLGAWDASNSQFAILSAVVRNPEKFADATCKFFSNYTLDEQTQKFFHLSNEGQLYHSLALDWGIIDADAKTSAFCTIFSGASSMTKAKRMLKANYPQLVEMTDAYKREYGDNALAILLQRCEAEVYIDSAYFELLDQSVWSLTKHDAIVVKESDKETSRLALVASMQKHGVVANLVWDNMKPKARKKRLKPTEN